ncbi:alpha/beta fold hydrolase [Nocardia sp. NPDC058379]|uniref:alpha/beta fold hydrolase n=1 Tax=unclassified Nocardia TaxID=2637762 RepID=UPI00365BBEC4
MTTSTALAARLRATEHRVAATYGLRITERTFALRDRGPTVRTVEIPGSGPPILWVNGLAAPALAFAPLLARFPDRHHLLIDLPGHHLAPAYDWSDRPVREVAAAVLTGVLDEFGLARAQLVGCSLGGLFALWTALDAPGRCTRLVLLGAPATALPGTRATPAMASTAAAVRGRVDEWSMRLPSPRFVARAALATALGPETARAMSDDLLDLHRLPLRLPGKAASYRALLRRLIQGRVPRPDAVLTDAELARIDVPALFVWGARDVFCPPDRARRSVAMIPGAHLAVVPGGHNPWLDDPPGCAELITESDLPATDRKHHA